MRNQPNSTAITAEDITDRPIVRLLVQYGKPHAAYALFGSVVRLVQSIPGMAPVFVIGVAFDAIFTERAYTLPFVPQPWIPESTVAQLWFTGLLVAVLVALKTAFNVTQLWAWNVFAQRTQHDIRVDTYDTVQRLEMGYFDNQRTGEVMSVLNDDVNNLEQVLTDGVASALATISILFGAILWLSILNWQLTIVALSVAPVIAVVNYRFSGLMGARHSDVRSEVGRLNSRLENNISGINVIKAFTREEFERERVETASFTHYEAESGVIRAHGVYFPSLRVLVGLSVALTFTVGGYWVLRGPPLFFTVPLTVGMLIPFLMYTRNLAMPMRNITDIINNYARAKASADRVLGVQQTELTITERENATPLDAVEGHVEYENVSFRYHRGREPVLRDVDFTAEAGETVGIVGPTGAGKTTLLKLLLRFYDVDSGTILIDEEEIRSVTLGSLRDSIGYISQEPFLFYGTVRENIAYGTPDVSDDEVIRAAKRAGADEFIEELPNGYETIVGERGVKLSGGQRQRIAIARALLSDPPILVLDEATSHVDNETEALIQNRLTELIANRTTFVIAHRLSTVREADTILVMQDGEIVERGPHDELIENDELYANLWRVQTGEIESLPEDFVRQTLERDHA